MAVDLLDHVPALKREVNPPGVDLFAAVQPVDWVGYLSDAFWEARLDGFLPGFETAGENVDIQIVPLAGGDDISKQYMALVVLYAGVKILRNRILNTNTSFRAKAGTVEFEQQNSATVLAEMLKQLAAVKDRILEDILLGGMTSVTILDAYSTRLYDPLSYHGGLELMG